MSCLWLCFQSAGVYPPLWWHDFNTAESGLEGFRLRFPVAAELRYLLQKIYKTKTTVTVLIMLRGRNVCIHRHFHMFSRSRLCEQLWKQRTVAKWEFGSIFSTRVPQRPAKSQPTLPACEILFLLAAFYCMLILLSEAVILFPLFPFSLARGLTIPDSKADGRAAGAECFNSARWRRHHWYCLWFPDSAA